MSTVSSGSDVHERFKVSFGVWDMLAVLLEPVELLALQSLCCFTYDVGISRVQPTWSLFNAGNCAFSIPFCSKFVKSIFAID